MDDRRRAVDELIEAIVSKLQANRAVLEQSLRFGRLTWRVPKDGDIEVNLEPKI